MDLRALLIGVCVIGGCAASGQSTKVATPAESTSNKIVCGHNAGSPVLGCPLLSPGSVDTLENGIRIKLRDPEARDAMLELVECHLEYARSHRSEKVFECPLFMEGANISPTADGTAVDVTSDDPKIATEIIKRAMQIVSR